MFDNHSYLFIENRFSHGDMLERHQSKSDKGKREFSGKYCPKCKQEFTDSGNRPALPLTINFVQKAEKMFISFTWLLSRLLTVLRHLATRTALLLPSNCSLK